MTVPRGDSYPVKHGTMSWMRTQASSPSLVKLFPIFSGTRPPPATTTRPLPPPSFNALDLLSNPFGGMMAFHSAGDQGIDLRRGSVGGEPFDSVQYPKVAVFSSDLFGDDGGLCLECGRPGLPLAQVSRGPPLLVFSIFAFLRVEMNFFLQVGINSACFLLVLLLFILLVFIYP